MADRLADEAARERIRTRLDENLVVEAGAGTGKTKLLVDRVEALIAAGKMRLSNVVAITFTEKAAAELRVRIRERIEQRLARADDSHERFRAALADLEIAPISTIHAFAADLLRERPVEARVDPAFTVADELAASLFRTEAWDRWLEAQKDEGAGPLLELIEYGIKLDNLRALGDVLLRYRDVPTGGWDPGPRPHDPVAWLIISIGLARRGT
jgi:ATP-dependent helicase/nuclease subunit A